MKKPAVLVDWEKRADAMRDNIPKVCASCEHHREITDEIFCRRFESSPPVDFQQSEGQCEEWSNMLHGIPF